MAVIRTYDKDGTVLASGTSPVASGGICWLGGEHYAVCSDARTILFTWDGETGTQSYLIASHTSAVENGKSCEVAHEYDENGIYRPAGHILFCTFEFPVGDPPSKFFAIRAWDIDKQNLLTGIGFLGPLDSSVGGITTNGNQWWVSYTPALTGLPRLSKFEIDGDTFTTLVNLLPSAESRDLCFDGAFLWSLEGSDIVQYEDGLDALPSEVGRFTGSGTGLSGLTTDGQNLLVLSDT